MQGIGCRGALTPAPTARVGATMVRLTARVGKGTALASALRHGSALPHPSAWRSTLRERGAAPTPLSHCQGRAYNGSALRLAIPKNRGGERKSRVPPFPCRKGGRGVR